ncbi:hypothetical protein [Candidatus Chlorohelix sp.]|uniref:ArnT family glycosyltransferase n=1 Tax=Candidatus Chlorohelix sp. TaxID=3139201 RepID=UPI00304402A0
MLSSIIAFARLHPGWTLFFAALFYRIFTASFYSQPGYTDAYYYMNSAIQFWNGKGFRDDYIWNYLARPLPESVIGNPSHSYWMPFTSWLIAVGYSLTFGENFWAGRLPNMLLTALIPPLSYRLGMAVGGIRYGWLAGGLAIFCGFYAPVFSMPDNHAPYAFISLLFLMLTAEWIKPGSLLPMPRKFIPIALGLLATIAYLTRVDGVFLLLVPPLCLLLLKQGINWRGIALMFGVAALTVIPWNARNFIVSGQLFPGGGAKTIFLRDYNDFFSFDKPLDLAYYLNITDPSPQWGIGALLMSKLEALWQNLLIIARPAIIMFTPFALIGLFSRKRSDNSMVATLYNGALWRNSLLLPFTVYLLILYIIMSLIFTFPSYRGSVYHSGGGLVPYISVAIAAGIDLVACWWSKLSRPHAEQNRRNFLAFVVMLGAILISIGWTLSQSANWDTDYRELQQVNEWLDSNTPRGLMVMTPDPTAYWYANRKPSIIINSDPLDIVLQVAKRYDARYLLLQPIATPAMTALYQDKASPGLKYLVTIGTTQIYQIEP